MALKSSIYDTTTETEIREIVAKYRCVAPNQVMALMPVREDRTPEMVMHALGGCEAKHRFEKKDGLYLATRFDRVDHALTDCIWIMIDRLGRASARGSNIEPVICSPQAKPLRICYLKENIIYYIAFITDAGEVPTLQLAEQYLISMGGVDGMKNVRLIVGTWDPLALTKLYPMSCDLMGVQIVHKRGDFLNMPEFKSIKIPAKEAAS